MSRILEALKQIEVRPAQPPSAPEHEPPEAPASETAAPATSSGAEAAAPGRPAEKPARAYTELADHILSQLPSDRPAALLFTSPGDGEGKTRVLVSLAGALVERTAGEVLVVDANFRSPDLAAHWGIEAAHGLADVLADTASWQQVVRSSPVEGVSVLPGVRSSTTAGESPHQSHLGSLLKELRGRYPLVLIDTSSLLHAEAAALARYCDAVYLVVRLKHTTRRAVRRAVRVLHDCQGRIGGGVVTGG